MNNVYRGLEFFRPIRGIREKGKPAQLFIYQISPGQWCLMLSEIFFRFVFAEVVVSLDAPDEFLKTRVMNLPESVVAGTHNTEEGEIITAKKKS